jgi:hypothetical protein
MRVLKVYWLLPIQLAQQLVSTLSTRFDKPFSVRDDKTSFIQRV